VVVSDQTGSIAFHLNRPDPAFLYKLTYFGQATVLGAPATETKTPLPGTGPYQISQYRPGETFVLTRNPYFRQWSFAAQPARYPDTIGWLKTRDNASALNAVLSGEADLLRLPSQATADAMSREVTDQLLQQHPSQFHTENPFLLSWMYLNTRMRPFDDVRVRQAINYAVNRRRIAEIYGGSARDAPTCQLLPASSPATNPTARTPSERPTSPTLART
jgi:ABC-type transport system substrate-binding protein